jgi:type II secretory pathway pseudopilin PulG
MRKQEGMTLIELTIATAILVIMVATMAGFFTHLVRQERGEQALQATTQNARYAIDDITSSARLANEVSISPDTTGPNLKFSQICFYQTSSMVEYYVPNVGLNHKQTLYKRIYPSLADVPPFSATSCPVVSGVNSATDVAVISNSDLGTGVNKTIGLNVVNLQASVTNPGYVANPTGIPSVTVRLSVISNLNDLMPGSTTQCVSGTQEYCSVTSYETTVSLRGTQSVGL